MPEEREERPMFRWYKSGSVRPVRHKKGGSIEKGPRWDKVVKTRKKKLELQLRLQRADWWASWIRQECRSAAVGHFPWADMICTVWQKNAENSEKRRERELGVSEVAMWCGVQQNSTCEELMRWHDTTKSKKLPNAKSNMNPLFFRPWIVPSLPSALLTPIYQWNFLSFHETMQLFFGGLPSDPAVHR